MKTYTKSLGPSCLLLGLASACSSTGADDGATANTPGTTVSSGSVTATIETKSSENGSFCQDVTITNTGSSVASWTLTLDTHGATVTSIERASQTTTATTMTVIPAGEHEGIMANDSVRFGFCSAGSTPPSLVSISVPEGGSGTGGASARSGLSTFGGSTAKTGHATVGGTTASAVVTSRGGAFAQGGSTSRSSVPAIGGSSTQSGSTAQGGATSLGGGSTAKGGTSSTGGGSSCPFPTSFKWTSSGLLAKPKGPDGQNWTSHKDFTVTRASDKYVVYGSFFNTVSKSYGGFMLTTTDLTKIDQIPQVALSRGAVAPTLVYFTPKKTWVLFYQWGFQYATSTDPTNANSWQWGKPLLNGAPSEAIDQTFICDSTKCYLFFAGDNGKIYRSSMPIGSFPSAFNGYDTIKSEAKADLFEAVQVYSVKGTGKYLMIVEAMGAGGRYFRAFSATDLGGEFTAISGAATEATPFAGKSNVTFPGGRWTDDISHGDIVRDDPSETQPIDPCNMKMLYQGRDPSSPAEYNALPYRPALLTKTN